MWWMVDTSAMIFLGSVLFARIGWMGRVMENSGTFFVSFFIATATNALFLYLPLALFPSPTLHDYRAHPTQGSNATGDCCSKCWSSLKPENVPAVVTTTTVVELTTGKTEADVKEEENVMETEAPPSAPSTNEATYNIKSLEDTQTTVVDSPATTPAKKKKKKTSYKSMMAGMLEEKTRDIEKEKEKLRGVTGGGTFQKIDKI